MDYISDRRTTSICPLSKARLIRIYISHITDTNRNQNTQQNTNFRLSRWLTIGFNLILVLLYCVDVVGFVHIPEIHVVTGLLSHQFLVVFLENKR
jgi:hypothetical protein